MKYCHNIFTAHSTNIREVHEKASRKALRNNDQTKIKKKSLLG